VLYEGLVQCLSISELLPDLPLKQIAAAVKRANGDQEQAVLLLLNEPQLAAPQQPTTPTINTTTDTNSTAATAPDQVPYHHIQVP
jgi:hypothetical protein